MAYLQVHAGHYFEIQSHQNFLRLQHIQAERGNIVDRHGNMLATNKVVYDLYWRSSGNKKLSLTQHALLKKITALFPELFLNELTTQIQKAEAGNHNFCIIKSLPHSQLYVALESVAHDQNIVVQTRTERHYPFCQYASHIVGYLGKINLQHEGRMGLEKLFESDLKGKKGTMLHATTSTGIAIEKTALHNPLAGQTIETTLDMNLQKIAETIFPDHYSGSLLIMNPINGDILTIISRPTFDAKLFSSPITRSTWNELQKNHTFLNRAFNPYPPGSVFKLVTVSAALEQGIITPHDSWFCKGYTTYKGRKYSCARKKAHGRTSIKEAVGQSCNLPFYYLAQHIDIDVVAEYAKLFGLGNKTGIIFNEHPGLVPNRQWKRTVKGEPWWSGESLSAFIGQSYLQVTPIQVTRMIASIFTGYLVRPRFLLSEPIEIEPLNLQPETIDFLQRSMKHVIRKGTGKRIHIRDLEIYAKTSTAQIASLEKSHQDAQFLEHAWFVAHFNYKKQQPLVLVILIENAGSSQIPTMIAKDFLLAYKARIDQHLVLTKEA